MLIGIRARKLLIRKSSLTQTEQAFLNKFLVKLNPKITVCECHDEFSLIGEPADLFQILNEISVTYDIELI